MQAAVGEARNLVASRNLEVRRFGEAASKPAREAFAEMTQGINAAAAKLAQFKKDMDRRKATALMQEAVGLMGAAEAELQQLDEAAAPFAKKDDEPPLADEELEQAGFTLVERARGSQLKLGQAQASLAQRQRELNLGQAAAFKDTLQDLAKRNTDIYNVVVA